MIRIMLGVSFLLVILAGCGIPSPADVNEEIEKTGKFINERSWDQALESTEKIDDYFNLIRANYNDNDVNDFEKINQELHNNISALDEKKSKKNWIQLSNLWKNMNRPE